MKNIGWEEELAMGKTRTKLIAFTLTMPHAGSWNGKWSGAGKLYCKVKQVYDQHPLLAKLPADFRYNWGDGWEANVRAEVIDGRQALHLRKASVGFLSYDWMIDSILRYGEIKIDSITIKCPTCGNTLTIHNARGEDTISTWCSKCSQTVYVQEAIKNAEKQATASETP
jgi:ribosomal protein S27E